MTWITIKEAAHLLDRTTNAIRKAAIKNNYKYRYVEGMGRGGKQIEILLESLPSSAQDKYNGIKPVQRPKRSFQEFTAKQREKALFKIKALSEYLYYKEQGVKLDDFLTQFNEENTVQISRKQLLYWQKKYMENKDFTALIDTRGGHNAGKTQIPKEHWDYFYNLYMSSEMRSVQKCYDMTKEAFKTTHHISSYKRNLKTIPKSDFIKYRLGFPTEGDDFL